MQMTMFDGTKKFVIDKPIRLISTFSGYDSQYLGLKYLKKDVESWRTCEWAVKSIQALKDVHFGDDDTDYSQGMTDLEVYEYLYNRGISANYNEPMTFEQIKRLGSAKARAVFNNIKATHNLVNIQQVHGEDLGIVDTDKYCYVMTYSFPCFTADSLILTRNGYKRIADIYINDEVLSHDNKYHKVVNKFENGIHDIYKINAMGIDEIKTTYNHKFYVREKYRKGHKAIRCFAEPIWKELKDITKDDYLGIAINQENRSIISNKLPTQNKDFWWIIGRYVGDGWIRQQGGIIICCAKNETYEIISKLESLNWNYNIVKERTVNKIHISKKALSDFVEQFGKGAGNKHLTQDILDLPIHYLKPFIEGYISADGCFTNNVYKATSISRELIYGVAQCVAKVYKTAYRIYKIIPPKQKIIEDRLVNQNIWYQLVFKTEKKKQDKAFYEDGYIWYPIKSIEYIGKDYVYDIEVQDSHSFTVQNTIVHNCQDLSSAGKGAGMGKGSGTRSGMLWEVERILDEIVAVGGELPQVLLMENVPEVIGTKNMPNFVQWRDKLEKIGYKCYWKVLNAKDYGVPQNRERCFMVSILGDYYYEFPQAIPLEHRLKDLLEDEVDEKYYLSDKAINGIENTKFNSASLENRTEKDGIMPTILARDYKDPKLVIEPKVIGGIGEKKSNGGTQWYQQDRVYDDNIAISITTSFNPYYAVKQVGQIYGFSKEKNPQAGRIYDSNGLSPTLDTCTGGNRMPKIIEPRICASRGRNPNNPSSRKSGEQLEQRLELGPEGVSNTLTTVQKDNYVIEPTNLKMELCNNLISNGIVQEGDVIRHSYANNRIDDFHIENSKNHDCCATLTTRADTLGVVKDYRIRKLTPKECGRLQGVKDDDIEKIQKNQSNASAYHLYGDSICVPVLMAIFGEMLGIDWKEKFSKEEWWKE